MTVSVSPAPVGAVTSRPVRSRSSLLRLLVLTRSCWPRLFLAVLLGVGTLACGIGLLVTAGWLISRAAQHPPVAALATAVMLVRIFGVGRGALRYSERLLSHDAVFRVLTDVRGTVFGRLVPLVPGGLPEATSGDVLQRLLGDVDAVQDLLLRVVAPILTGFLAAAGTVIFATVLLPVDGLILLVALLLAGVAVPWWVARSSRQASEQLAPDRGALSGELVDTLQGLPDILATGAANDRIARITRIDARLTTSAEAASSAAGLGAGLTSFATGLAVVGAVLTGVAAVHDGHLSTLYLAVLVLLPLAAFESVAAIPAAAVQISVSRRSAERLFAVLDAPPPVHEPVVTQAVPAGCQELRVDALRVVYPDGRTGLAGIDLTMPAGGRLAVVGASGSGKTTLLLAALRLVEPSSGSIRYGGVDLSGCAGDEVRVAIGACLSDAHVFAGSLRENLLLGRPDAGLDDLSDVLRRTGLTDWVAGLPAGLDTPLGSRGTTLSGGERQRLCLARALLSRPTLLLLDEPTEGLDAGAEAALLADLLSAAGPAGVLIVTHRLDGLAAVDEIVVLSGGVVVERGTHAELLTAGGWYSRAWADQHPGV